MGIDKIQLNLFHYCTIWTRHEWMNGKMWFDHNYKLTCLESSVITHQALFTTLVGDSFLNHFATVWIAKTITLINDYYFLAPPQIVTPIRYMSHHTYSCRFLVMEATFSCSFDCIAWWVLFTSSWLQYWRILSSSFRKDNLQKWSETLTAHRGQDCSGQ